MNTQHRAHAGMLLSTSLVATSFPVVDLVAGALDSVVLTALRFALAALLFLPLVALRHRAAALPGPRALLRYAALSAPLVGFFLAMFEALRTTTPQNAGALFALGPAFAALFALLLVGERVGRRQLLGLTAGFAGAVWILVRGELDRLVAVDLDGGDALFLAGVASLGLYSALVKRLHRGEPMAVVTFWTLVTGTLWLVALRWRELQDLTGQVMEPRVIGAVAYLAVFTTLVTFLLGQRGTLALGATRAMSYTYLNPALVMLLGWGLGRGAPGWGTLPGLLLTAVAMTALLRAPAPPRAAASGGPSSASARARAPRPVTHLPCPE